MILLYALSEFLIYFFHVTHSYRDGIYVKNFGLQFNATEMNSVLETLAINQNQYRTQHSVVVKIS